MTMRNSIVLAAALLLLPAAAVAQQEGLRVLALKGGEVHEVQEVWFVSNCRSMLKAPPEVEKLEGPPEITLKVEPAMVIPRRFNCAKPIEGGKVIVTVGEVKAASRSKLVYRTLYRTKEGDRHVGQVYEVSLYPGPAPK